MTSIRGHCAKGIGLLDSVRSWLVERNVVPGHGDPASMEFMRKLLSCRLDRGRGPTRGR